MNKRGNIWATLVLISALFVLLIGGVVVAFGSSIINYVMDEAVPELTSVGMVGEANVSTIAGYGINPVNSFVQSWTWMTGLAFFLGLLACLGLAFIYRSTGENWTLGLFFGLMLILVLASLFISNVYEDFYSSNDEIGLRLQEQQIISFFLIYSPIILTLVGFIGGIIIFTGDNRGGYI